MCGAHAAAHDLDAGLKAGWISLMNLNRYKISTRLACAFGFMALLVLVLGLLALRQLQAVQGHFQTLQQQHYPQVVTVHRIKALMLDSASTIRNLFVIVSEPEIRRQLQRVDRLTQESDALLLQLQQASTQAEAQPLLKRRCCALCCSAACSTIARSCCCSSSCATSRSCDS